MSNTDAPSKDLPVAGEMLDVHANPRGRITFNQRFQRGDKTQTYDALVRFTHGVPAIVLPVTEDGNVIVTRQFRPGVIANVVELPGGCARGADVGKKTSVEIALQELLDETGYRPCEVKELGKCYPDPFLLRIHFDLYLAAGCVKVAEPELDESEKFERLEVITMPLSSWLRDCLDGTIPDAKSVVTTMRALPHLTSLGVVISY